MNGIPVFEFNGEIKWIPFKDAEGKTFTDGGISYTVTRGPKLTYKMIKEMREYMEGIGPRPDWIDP